jgi:hypothetical protein
MSFLSPRRRLGASLAVLVVLGLGVGACGDDDDSASGDEDTTTTTRPTTTESRPPGIEEQVQDLLHTYDDLIRQITADPEVASDPRNTLYDQLRGLMAPNTVTTAAVVNALVSQGNRGVAQRPQGDANLPIERRVEGQVENVSEDELRVPICTHLNYGLFDSEDQQIERVDARVEPAVATIIRSNGSLRIRQFETIEDESRCQEGQ